LETPMEFVFWISGIRLPPIGRNSIAGVDHHQPPGIGNGKLLAIISRIRMASNDDRKLFEDEELGWADPRGAACTKPVCLCYTESGPITVPGTYLPARKRTRLAAICNRIGMIPVFWCSGPTLDHRNRKIIC
jgi:hypothetical protein